MASSAEWDCFSYWRRTQRMRTILCAPWSWRPDGSRVWHAMQSGTTSMDDRPQPARDGGWPPGGGGPCHPGHTRQPELPAARSVRHSLDAILRDALFAGEVGRIDLLVERKEAENAGLLYESLFGRLLPLATRSLSARRTDPDRSAASRLPSASGPHRLERKHNPRLQAKKQRAVRGLSIGEPAGQASLLPPHGEGQPEGRPILEFCPPRAPGCRKLFCLFREAEAQILDTRQEIAFAAAHVPALNPSAGGLPALRLVYELRSAYSFWSTRECYRRSNSHSGAPGL